MQQILKQTDGAEHTGGRKILQGHNFSAKVKTYLKSPQMLHVFNINVKYLFGFYPNYRQKRTYIYCVFIENKEASMHNLTTQQNEKWGKEEM